MKTHTFLGLAWLAFCGYFGLLLLWQIVHGVMLGARPTLDVFIGIVACAVYLSGMFASFFLFRGAHWAHGVIRIVAALTFVAVVAEFIAMSFDWFACGIGIFSLVSLVLLSRSRHAPVA